MQEHGKKVGRIFDYNIQKYYLCTAIVLWCNGSTTVFGSVSGGSNPPGTTQIIRRFIMFLRIFWFMLITN